MLFLPVAAALGASLGWATGVVLAHYPATRLGTFEFTRIQLIACAAIMSLLSGVMGYWQSIFLVAWGALALSIIFGIVVGNLAMIECLRLGGPRRTELLMTLKAPIVTVMAYVWLGETLSPVVLVGIAIVLSGICLAINQGSKGQREPDLGSKKLVMVIFLGLVATGSQGLGFLVVKPALVAGAEPVAVSAARLLGAALLISVVALYPLNLFAPKNELTPSLLGWTILPGFIGYGISSSLLLYAFANFDAGVAAVLGSLSPVLVLPILWVKNGERPGARGFFGAVLAVVGVAIVILG